MQYLGESNSDNKNHESLEDIISVIIKKSAVNDELTLYAKRALGSVINIMAQLYLYIGRNNESERKTNYRELFISTRVNKGSGAEFFTYIKSIPPYDRLENEYLYKWIAIRSNELPRTILLYMVTAALHNNKHALKTLKESLEKTLMSKIKKSLNDDGSHCSHYLSIFHWPFLFLKHFLNNYVIEGQNVTDMLSIINEISSFVYIVHKVGYQCSARLCTTRMRKTIAYYTKRINEPCFVKATNTRINIQCIKILSVVNTLHSTSVFASTFQYAVCDLYGPSGLNYYEYGVYQDQPFNTGTLQGSKPLQYNQDEGSVLFVRTHPRCVINFLCYANGQSGNKTFSATDSRRLNEYVIDNAHGSQMDLMPYIINVSIKFYLDLYKLKNKSFDERNNHYARTIALRDRDLFAGKVPLDAKSSFTNQHAKLVLLEWSLAFPEQHEPQLEELCGWLQSIDLALNNIKQSLSCALTEEDHIELIKYIANSDLLFLFRALNDFGTKIILFHSLYEWCCVDVLKSYTQYQKYQQDQLASIKEHLCKIENIFGEIKQIIYDWLHVVDFDMASDMNPSSDLIGNKLASLFFVTFIAVSDIANINFVSDIDIENKPEYSQLSKEHKQKLKSDLCTTMQKQKPLKWDQIIINAVEQCWLRLESSFKKVGMHYSGAKAMMEHFSQKSKNQLSAKYFPDIFVNSQGFLQSNRNVNSSNSGAKQNCFENYLCSLLVSRSWDVRASILTEQYAKINYDEYWAMEAQEQLKEDNGKSVERKTWQEQYNEVCTRIAVESLSGCVARSCSI